MGLSLPQAIIGTAGGDYFVNFRQEDFIDKETGEYITRIYLPYGISAARRNRFLAEVQRLDQLIDLDLFVDTPSNTRGGASIDVYEINDSSDSSPGYSNDYGEIYLNLNKLKSDRQYGNTLLHELGHTIGLNHPWEDGGPAGEASTIDDRDRFSDEDTIMAYRSKQDDDERFRDADIQGLQIIWGIENGTRPKPSYVIQPLASTINEGVTLNIRIITSNLAAGTNLYWAFSGSGLNSDDVDGNIPTLRGNVQIQADGTGLITLPTKRDLKKEGDEKLELRIYLSQVDNEQLAASTAITIRDTSTFQPTESYFKDKYNTITSNKTYGDPITSYRISRLVEDGSFGIEGPGTNNRLDRLAKAGLTINFSDNVSFSFSELKAVFDQVQGFDDITGQVFRLYNAAFKRIPDANGFAYWNWINSSQQASLAQTALYFTQAPEFIERYGKSPSSSSFVSGLYNNILGRDPDTAGLAFWQTALSTGRLDQAGVLVEFAQSGENKQLFSDCTGLA